MNTADYRKLVDKAISEGEFQANVIDAAQKLGWRCAHFRSVRVARADGSTYHATPVQADGEGFPDLILIRGYQGIAWELKAEKGRATLAQLEWLEAFRRAGFETGVKRPSDMDEILEVLK